MITDRSQYESILSSSLQYEDLDSFTQKVNLLIDYLDEALDLENLVSPIALFDEFDEILHHIEQLANSSDNISRDLTRISQKKADAFDDLRYQIGPDFVELHNRLFPIPDPKERHHILKIACYFTKYDSVENRDFIMEIKKIHDAHFKKPIQRD